MRRSAILLAAMLVALSGCGGGGTATFSTTTGVPTNAPTTSLVTPSPQVPGAPPACPETPEPTGTVCVTVAIVTFAFDPPVVTIPASGRVVFVNHDDAPHSIAWADGTPGGPRLGKGDSTEREFRLVAPGTYEYTCGIHGPRMSGRVVVDASLPVP